MREDPESDEEQDLNPQPATKPSKIVAEALPTREKGKARQKLDLLDKEDSDEEMAREDIGTSRRHKRKSVLRPKSSRYASKGAGKGSGVGPVDHQEDSDGEDVTIMNVPLPKKTPVPRNTRAAKRIRVDLGSTDVAWAEPVVSESENHHHAESRPAAESGEPPSASTKPQGPGDTWSCAVDGCTYKVYQARKAKPQQMITEHLTDHNARAQDKLDLVFEEERPHLPIT